MALVVVLGLGFGRECLLKQRLLIPAGNTEAILGFFGGIFLLDTNLFSHGFCQYFVKTG